jgi:apolipoprotein N-acyltransferase
MYFSRMELSPASVAAYYRGSDETFQPARTFGSMVESSHGHFAMMAMVLLVLTHLYIFVPGPRRLKAAFVGGTFAATFLSETSGWLVRFVHPAFAILKPVAFLASQAFLGLMLGLLATFLVAAARRRTLHAVDDRQAADETPRRAAAGGDG